MGDFYKNSKDYRKKGEYSSHKEFKRAGPSGHREKDGHSRRTVQERKVQQPTILIKSRDAERAPSPSASSTAASKKEEETPTHYQIQTKTPSAEAPAPLLMTASMPLLSPTHLTLSLPETFMEYLVEDHDYLVVGCLGCQNVGKSTIMSLLANSNCDTTISKSDVIFPIAAHDLVTSAKCRTAGVDIYVTKNRMFLLDCQPILSASLQTEGNAEMESLELAAFLFSICHVVLFVQDFFTDPDLIRFLQTAEMLKPSTSPSPTYDEVLEHFPHLIFIHNKSESWEFRAERIREIQDTYLKAFSHSRLQIQTGFGVANGEVISTLNSESCGELINLFLLPNYDSDDASYTGHPSFKDLFRHLRNQIISTPRTPLTHTNLTARHWFHFASKVWENIHKSSFFNEYDRLINAF